jgi:hypothetical protein
VAERRIDLAIAADAAIQAAFAGLRDELGVLLDFSGGCARGGRGGDTPTAPAGNRLYENPAILRESRL